MAVYCVDPAGSNTAPYDTKAKAATSLYTILGLSLTGANTVNIFPGTYDAAFLFNLTNTKYNNLTIKGVDSTGIFSNNPELVTLGGNSASTLFYVSGAAVPENVTIKNLTLKYNGASRKAFSLNTATIGWVLDGLVIEPKAASGYGNPISVKDAAGFVIKKCRIRSGEIASGAACVSVGGASDVTITDSVIEGFNGDLGWHAGGVYVYGSSSVDIDNVVISGTGSLAAVYSYSSGPVTVSNCPCLMGASVAVVQRAGSGTVTVTNSNLIAYGYTPAGRYFAGSVTDGGGNTFSRDPRIHSYAKHGYVIPCVDDGNLAQLEYVNALESVLSSRGMKGTWYVYGNQGAGFDMTTEGDDRQAVRDIISRGIFEIGSHTWSHTDVTATTGTYGSLSHSGGTTKTYKIDLENNIFAVDVDGTTISVALAEDNSDTMSSVMAQINASDATWVFTKAAILTSTGVRISSLKPTSGFVNISTPLYFDKDSASSSFYQDEIIDFKSLLESWINALGDVIDPQTGVAYVCNSFAEPGGAQDARSIAAVKAAGYLGSRPGGGVPENLSSMDIYKKGFMVVNAGIIGATEAKTIGNTHSMCAQAAQNGLVVFLLSHGTSESPVSGTNSWETILDVVKTYKDKGNITVCSAQEFYSEVRAAPWIYTDGVVSRTYTTYAEYNEPGFSMWSTCDSSLPTDGQVFKSHAMPIAARKVTVFPGVASAAQINEAAE